MDKQPSPPPLKKGFEWDILENDIKKYTGNTNIYTYEMTLPNLIAPKEKPKFLIFF